MGTKQDDLTQKKKSAFMNVPTPACVRQFRSSLTRLCKRTQSVENPIYSIPPIAAAENTFLVGITCQYLEFNTLTALHKLVTTEHDEMTIELLITARSDVVQRSVILPGQSDTHVVQFVDCLVRLELKNNKKE